LKAGEQMDAIQRRDDHFAPDACGEIRLTLKCLDAIVDGVMGLWDGKTDILDALASLGIQAKSQRVPWQ